ncbi:MAG: hypothetical protein ACJAZ9_000671 [Neolewinella sp.]|jgi:hypothetical protein
MASIYTYYSAKFAFLSISLLLVLTTSATAFGNTFCSDQPAVYCAGDPVLSEVADEIIETNTVGVDCPSGVTTDLIVNGDYLCHFLQC